MQVFVEVCQAVSYAHAKGVLHMDLKPANVMLGSHGEVQVMDWGLSHILHDGQVQTASVAGAREGIAGTPAYMAPEQASGEPGDERVDVYALGVMLYELLTFERPFDGDTYEVLKAKLEESPDPPRKRAPGALLPVELERACLTALAKSVERRFQSIDELYEAVQGWRNSEEAKARRHETTRLIARVVAGALVLIALGTTVFIHRLDGARDVAMAEKNVAVEARKRAVEHQGEAEFQAYIARLKRRRSRPQTGRHQRSPDPSRACA